MIKGIKIQRKMGQESEGGYSRIRVIHGQRKGQTPRYIIRCGCCRAPRLDIHYDEDGQGLEINGINGSIKNWSDILLPFLGIAPDKKRR
ncbi:MAG TPA: hypothetical protein ENH35_05570 [Candidatus Moranbacteria bacterium]|nr:hypothetical protein [Candidatus Moranbacteria bacterium]